MAPKYIVLLDEHLYVRDEPAGPRRLVGRADVALSEGPPDTPSRTALGILEAPSRVELVVEDVERVPFVGIRDRHNRDLVTMIELLSPSNKRLGPDREQYLTRRREILAGPAHLVEIDLLRGGRPMPSTFRPVCSYSVLVSRSEGRPIADLWPIGLRERLPEIGVTLRAPDGDARVDLQSLIHQVYDAAGYAHFIFSGEPDPPLAPEDARWAQGIMSGIV